MPIGNNSGRIMSGYKKWLTKKQRSRLSGLYKGLRQSTADEMRDQYLDQRGSMNRVRDVASAYGLGAGYRARKQMTFDRAQEQYGRQLAMQADNAFESEVVRAANESIQAENERRQKEYARRLKAAQNKRRAAQDKYNRDMAAYNEQQARLERLRNMKTPKTAQTWKAPVVQNGTTPTHVSPFSWQAHTLTQYTDTGTGNNSPKGGGKSGLIAAALLAGHTGKRLAKGNGTTKPRAGANNSGGKISGKVGRYNDTGTGKYTTASPTQKMIGRPEAPNFETDPSFALPLEPQMQAQLEVQLKEYQAATPEQQEQIKLGAKDQYAKDVAQYAGAMERLNTLQRGVQQAQSIMAQFQDLEAKIRNTRYSPEQRRGFSQQLSGLQRQYASVMQQQRGASQEISGLQRYIQNAFPRINASRALLGGMGIKYDIDSIAFDADWVRRGNQLVDSNIVDLASNPNRQSDRAKEFWKRADAIGIDTTNVNVLGDNPTGTSYTAVGQRGSTISMTEPEREWFDANGFGNILRAVERDLQYNTQYASLGDAVRGYLQQYDRQVFDYGNERSWRTAIASFARMKPQETSAAIAQGEAKTGLTKGLSMGRKMASENTNIADVLTSVVGRDRGSVFVSSLEKKLDLPEGWITINTYGVMTDEDIAFIDYCFGTGNEDAARAYIYQLTEWGNAMKGERRAAAIEGVNAPKAVQDIRSAVWQILYGGGSLVTNIKDIFKNNYRPASEAEMTASQITQNRVTERGWNPQFAQTFDSAMQSAGNNAAAFLVGGAIGKVGGALGGVAAKIASHAPGAIMGLSAAGQAKQQALREGYGAKAATMYGILNGVSETVLQENVGGLVGFGDRGALTKALTNAVNSVKSPVARTLINQGLDILSEIGEEEFGNIVENINRSVTLGEKRGLFDGFAEQAGETAVSTAISTVLLNALHIPAQLRNERGYSSIAKASGMSLKDAKLLLETEAAITNGEQVDPKDLSRYNELTAVLTAAMPENVAKAIADGKMTVADWVTSAEGAVQSKLMGKLSASERTAVQTEAVDHTEKLKGKTKEQQRDYLLAAAPTGKVGSAYYTTTDGKPINIRNLNATQKANYVLAQKCAKAFEGSVDVVIHDTLPLSNGAMVGSDGKLHIALDTTNEQGRESIAYWTLAHEAGHALKIADGEAWNEMFDVLTDYAKNYKDRDGKNLYDALVDSITNQYKYDSNSDAFNDEMFSLIAERMVGSEGEQWAATLGDNTIFDAIANDRNASAKAKRGFLGKLKTSVERLSRQFRDGGFAKERKRLAKIREQLTEAYKRINEGKTVKEKYAEQKEKAAAPAKTDEQNKALAEETEGTRFQMKAPVETTDRLIAWHNMSEDALRSALELGGLAMPSWAIKTADKAHTSYGDISVIAPRALVDPKQNRNSMIFGGDAWTPVFPDVGYKISSEAVDALENEIKGLVGEDLYREIGGAALDTDNIADQFSRSQGAVSTHYKTQPLLRYAYLKSIGKEIDIPKKAEKLDRNNHIQNGAVERFAHKLVDGKQTLQKYLDMYSQELMEQKDLLEAVSDAILSEYKETLPMRVYESLKERYEPSNIGFNEVDSMLDAAKKYLYHGIREVTDKYELARNIDKVIDEAAYEKWIGDKLNATIERKGIRNNKDMFTPSGNRRSFDALHYEYNLANIVKAMKSQPKQGRTQFLSGPGSVKGAALKSYNTVEQVRADRGRLVNTAEEAEAAYKEYSQNLESILDRMGKDRFSSADALIEVLQHAKTEDGIYRYMERELKDWYNVSKDIAHDIYELIGEINALPMEYFEGKTYDAVTFDETAAVVVPDNTSEELKQQLADAGANVVEYKAGDNEDRLEKVNSVEGVRFQNRAADAAYLSLAEKYRDGTATEDDRYELATQVYEAAEHAMPNSKVRSKRDGALRKVYHYTDRQFWEFKPSERSFGSSRTHGTGYYISTSETEYSNFGKRKLTMYADIQNPFEMSLSAEQAQAIYDKYFRPHHEDRYHTYEPHVVQALQSSYKVFNYLKEAAETNNTTTDAILSEMGFDGIHDGGLWVAFDSSQLKLADPVTYDDNGDIIPLSERFNAGNEDIRYSMRKTDAEYMKAVEDGDEATQARIIEEAAKRAGYTIKAYHGTNNNFTVFDKAKRGEQTDFNASSLELAATAHIGFWFNNNDVRGRIGQKRSIASYLNLNNPLEYDSLQDLAVAIRESYANDWDELDDDFYIDDRTVAASKAADAFVKKIRAEGYDGVVINDEELGGISYAVFDPSQIKSADLITRDDDGNIIPPSKRFDISDEDIRYQQRDFRIDFNVPQLDTKALHEAVKGGEGTVENRFEVKYEKTDSGFAVHITDKDSGKTYDRAETVTEGNAKAEAERAAAAVIRNIKRGEQRRAFREYADKREADARLAERMHEGAIRARIERKANETEAEYKARIKKIYEDRYRREIKNTALKWNKKLVDMLARPTENKHVPVQLARSVAEFCEEVTKYLDGTTKRGEKILDKIRKAYDRAFTDEQTILRAKSEDAGYDARGAVLNNSQKDEQLAEMMKELSEITAEKSFAELTRDEMDALLNVVRGVAHTVTDANKLIGEAEGMTVWQAGSTMIEQLENAPKVSSKLRGYLATSLDLRRLARIFSGSNEDAEFVKLVEQLNQGAIEKERIAQELQAIFKPVTDEYGDEIRKWYGKKAEWINTGIIGRDGLPVKITKGMRVSLALHVLNEGNMRHIERGGLTIPDAKLYAQGKLADAYANGKLVRLTAEQINDIIANMTEAEKAYVEAAKQLFHDRAGFYVNKTSLQLAGYTKANVENYFPIHTDKNFNKTDFASMSMDGSIEGQGFLKERVAASNPVYLEDITSVVNRQIRGVALYAGMAIPVRNFNAVMNAAAYEDENGNWVPRTTVKQTLAKTMGQYGAKVVEGFVEDASEMSQRVDVTPVERIAGKLSTNYVKAVLLGNLKVAMKQVASYPTAAAVIPWKYLNKALVAGGRNRRIISRADVDLINKYTPLYQMRREGNANEVASLMNKPGMEQKLPWLLGWITKMDVMTVGRLWSAAEYMVEDTLKDLTKGSDEFYREVAKVFNQTIQQTQPNFTPLQRSAALRSKNPIVRSLTLFGTQRMQNGGILIEAAYELKQAKGKSAEEIAAARRKLGRAVASQITQNLLLLLATIVVDALRGRMKSWQDDDDELTLESIGKKMGDTFLSNILGSFLGGTEFYETISNLYKKANGQTTYDTEFSVPALDAIETIMSFGQSGIPNFINYLNGEHTDEEKLNKLKSFSTELAKVAGYATGLPLENAVKDVFKGFYPAYKDIRDWRKTGELIPYLWQSGKLDSAKTRERYEEWIDSGHKGSEFFALDKQLKNAVGGRDGRAEILYETANLSYEDKAKLMEMYDTSDGYAEGSKFYNKNGKELYDFAAEPAQESEAPAEAPSEETAVIPEATTAPAATETPVATTAPKSDKYTKAAEKWAAYGVSPAQAKSAVEKWEKSGNASEYRSWLSKQGFTGRQKFAMYAQANADVEEKAVNFNKKYGTKYEALWEAYSKYDSNSFHGEEYRAWVEKQTNDYRQRFSLVEFAEPRSNWIEHAEELHKTGVSYEAVWKAARYAKNQSGTGKKDRIIKKAKSLGMTAKQAENIYKWFG